MSSCALSITLATSFSRNPFSPSTGAAAASVAAGADASCKRCSSLALRAAARRCSVAESHSPSA